MSTDAPPAPEQIEITEAQADKILDFAIKNRMYEDPTGGLQAVPAQTRLDDAATLVFQARRAWNGGNRNEPVKEILFIAEVDMSPAPAQSQVAASAAEVPAAPPAAAPPAANGADPYAASTDEQLQQALQVFNAAPSNPSIQAEIDKINAVITQRSGSPAQAPAPAQPAQEVPSPAQPPAPVPTPGAVPQQPDGGGGAASPPVVPVADAPAAPQPAPTPAGGAPQPHVAPQHAVLPPVPGRPNPGVISAGGAADAGDVAGAQAPVPGPQGAPAPAQPPAASSQDRQFLLSSLTYEILSAYGQTIEQAQALEDGQLRYMLANPTGIPSQAAPAAAPAPQGRAVSPDRLKLEEQVTGPMLKAWGRGRQEVATGAIGDNLLALMLANPTKAGIAQEQIDQAVSLDSGAQPAEAPVPSPQVSQAVTPAETPPAVPEATPPAQPAPEPAAPAPPAAAVVPSAAAPPPAPASPETPQAAPPQQGSVETSRPPSTSQGVAEAMDIIAREHLPIPPDIDDPYRLPNDVSKSSDADLWSLHARAHAVEARCNWIISERDDTADDYVKLIADERRRAEDELPETEEGKKLTKVRKAELIDSDGQVVAYEAQLKDHNKGTAKIKVIRDNAHRDCERLSRQWSFRHREEMASPTR